MRILLKRYDSTLDIPDKPHYIPGFGVYVNKATDYTLKPGITLKKATGFR